MSDLADFVLDFCRTQGGVVEPPAYGVFDVLMPEAAATQLGIEPFQRFAFDEKAVGEGVTRLAYGHPLVERMAELARAAPANTRFYINEVRLDKTDLPSLACSALSFPNAVLAEVPGVMETRALFGYVRFNFKATLISDEKREQLVSVLMNAQTGTLADEFSVEEEYRLAETSVWGDLPLAPAARTSAADGLAPEALRLLLERAGQAARLRLSETLAAFEARASRLLELDRARLEAYYADLERDLERRLKRAADDETKQASLESKLVATRADHASKLADAEAKYQVRLELDLLNLAVIFQPKLTRPMRIENRQTSVTRALIWDPLRYRVEPLACDVCFRPNVRLFLCHNGHLACAECLAPQCVDCKRVYCRNCAAEVTTCVVCDRPVCQKSLTRCKECGRGTCREHANLCHAADGQPPRSSPPETKSTGPEVPGPEASASAPQKRVARVGLPALAEVGLRLRVEIRKDETQIVAFVLTQDDEEIAQRLWRLTGDGLMVVCRCEKGRRCPSARRMLKPKSPPKIEAQLEDEIAHFRAEYHIPPYRTEILVLQQGELVQRLTKVALGGLWKDRAFVAAARQAFSADDG
jgi:hypothetical protein